ncbi:MAG TPA: response regulator transcription factor [Gaiellaceae bacterium]|jgi:DNA-binding NarL/FixJ family response regulator|nr:response regulator transcription factor [Gaiellaceae bacterium]
MRPVRVLIVDDHPLFAKTIEAMLAGHPEIEVVAEAADGIEALRLATSLMPDVILMDVDMPRLDGLSATRRIAELGLPCRVIVLTASEDVETSRAALRAGASAYLTKGLISKSLVPAILNLAGVPARLTEDGGADLASRRRVG